MQANTNVLDHDVRHVQIEWERIRARARNVFTRDRMAGIALAAANGAVMGAILLSLYRAIQVSAYTGLGAAAFGSF